MTVALPACATSRGIISGRALSDGRGNYNIGAQGTDHFPATEYDKVDALRGLNIVITTRRPRPMKRPRHFSSAFRFPFKN